jgi:hypothetical protein
MDDGRPSAADAGRAASSQFREWFWSVLAVNFLLILTQDVFGVDGTAWTVLRVAVVVVLIILLCGWVYAGLREASSSQGGWRPLATGWAPPLLMAAAVVGVIGVGGLLVRDLLP